MRWKIDDIPVFVEVVDRNGITAAAEALRRPKSTISAAISRLEQDLGLRLLERNSRNLSLTAEGEVFYRKALDILEQVREADAIAAGLTAEPAGRLTVALPSAFAQELFAPNMPRFKTTYPKIDLEVVVTSHGLDLLRDTVDLAVVVGAQADSDLVARVIAAGQLVWVSSPAYLNRHEVGPFGPETIKSHVLICEKRYGLSRMPVHIDGKAAHVDLKTGVAHVNDPLVVRQALLSGGGVSLLPFRYVDPLIADGRLVEVFSNVTFDMAASSLSAVYKSKQHLPPRVRAFLDFLAECGEW